MLARRALRCAAVAAAPCPSRVGVFAAATPCLRPFQRSFSSTSPPSTAASSPPLTPIQRIQKDLAYCKAHVHQHDNDQYLCSLLLPGDVRAGVHILRAFNLELAQVVSRHSMPTVGIRPVQEVFSEQAKENAAAHAAAELNEAHEPTEAELNALRVGLMKLQWWRDGLETAMEKVEGLQLDQPTSDSAAAAHAQPVLNMLAIAIKQYKLTPRWISRMIEARERSLEEGQPADINALLAYSESTSSALLYLTLECLNVRDVHADHAASHIGKATGIALTLRSLPYAASKQQVLIPKAIVQHQQLDLSTLLSGSNSPELANCVFELASIAKSHLEHARQLMAQVPPEARPALTSAVLCDRFLDRLERHQFNVFDPSLGLLPTAPKGALDPAKEMSTAGVTLSGSNQGLQPMWLRLDLLKHKWKGTY